MTDAALENATARRVATADRLANVVNEINGLLDQHTKIKEELEEIDQFIHMWHQMAGTQPPAKTEQRGGSAPAEGGKRIRPKNPPREIVADTCVEYIRLAGRPMMRSELLEKLTEDGIIIRGKDPAMVLSTMLWRSKGVIVRVAKGGYWLPDEPMPSTDTPARERLFT